MMKFRASTLALLSILSAAAAAACGGDDKKDKGAGGAGSGGQPAGGSGGTGGEGASGGAGAVSAGASGGSAGTGAVGGTGGDPVDAGGGTRNDAGVEAGTDGGLVLQGLQPYPTVPYPPENLASADKELLGKILFWEEQIGEDGTMACGTCHRAEAGGSDPRSATSFARLPGPDGLLDPTPSNTSDDIRGGQGVVRCQDMDGGLSQVPEAGLAVQITGRKPPTYIDAMFAPDIFWDGRASRNFTDPDTGKEFLAGTSNNQVAGYGLESQAIGPPLSDVEMACIGQTWDDIHAVLETATPLANASAIPDDMKNFIAANGNSYPTMFAAAFGSDHRTSDGAPNTEINTVRIAFAIATHERRLTSDETPWDRYNAGDDTALTPNQIEGFELFLGKAKCNGCHRPPMFADHLFHFIGFHKPSWDSGHNAISGMGPVGAMKTPTLRNVGLREPGGLLHRGDGPGRSLDSVMELYNSGGLRSDPDIAAVPIDPLIEPLELTQAEIDKIIDFLRNGLTDDRVRSAEPPFDRPKLSTEP